MRLLPRFQLRRLTTPSRTTPTFAGGRCADDQPAGAGTTTQTSASLRPPSLPLTLSSPVSPFAPTLTSIRVACRSTRWGTAPAATILPVLAAARRLFLTLVPVPRLLKPAGPLQRPDGPDRGKAGCPCATRLASTIRLGSPSLPLPRSHASKTSRPSWTVWMCVALKQHPRHRWAGPVSAPHRSVTSSCLLQENFITQETAYDDLVDLINDKVRSLL